MGVHIFAEKRFDAVLFCTVEPAHRRTIVLANRRIGEPSFLNFKIIKLLDRQQQMSSFCFKRNLVLAFGGEGFARQHDAGDGPIVPFGFKTFVFHAFG